MDRLTQIVRNFFIRFEGLFSVIFKGFVSFIRNIFGFFATLFGFTSSQYYLESDAAESIKRAAEEQPVKTNQNTTSETPTAIRRRSQKKVDDYYLNMARDVQKQ
ncbi:threonine dehydratase [Nostoc sp. FACHB-152]|uniref:threonine dehydratase n=1 Tax=unclassified Nostoc TaxID=2593658 RepID=UPI001682F69B|nr:MULTISPECIES: threonine dehydratase [unclassified Nostoc]MBD2450892.1 threonine dehydratase [Nostoc sp. FACHB-152]MBD2470071.1 threonine dehydratase [Nostoc sp. FACHB-145]